MSAAPTANNSPSGTSLLSTYFPSEIPSVSSSTGPKPSRSSSLSPSKYPPGQTGPDLLSTPYLRLSITTATTLRGLNQILTFLLIPPVDTPY